jgi:hypothetical protein
MSIEVSLNALFSAVEAVGQLSEVYLVDAG